MFSLILAILSIVLVGLLAVATIYYMGDSINSRGPEASAATVINQGEQIYAAMELRRADGVGPLLSLNALTQEVSGRTYLTDIPVPPPSAYLGATQPVANDWIVLAPQKPASSFMIQTKVGREVCHFINRKAHTNGDIHEAADPARRIQCFGSAAPFTVLFGFNGELASDVVAFNSTVVDPADQIPVDPDDGGVVTFIDTITVASAPPSNTTGGTGGTTGTGGTSGPSSGPATPPDFTPTVSSADPRTVVTPTEFTIYSPLAPEAIPAVAATYPNTDTLSNDSYCKTLSGGTICKTIPFPSVNYASLDYAGTRITNPTTDTVIVLGTIPTVIESLGFGIPLYDNMVSIGGRQGGLANLQLLQASLRQGAADLYATYGDGDASTFPTYPEIPPYNDTSVSVSSVDVAPLCFNGQVLNPGQSCLLYTQDADLFAPFLTATTAGVEIPFTYGLGATSASKAGKFIVIE